jgi:uncharacterized Zn ribbon protein
MKKTLHEIIKTGTFIKKIKIVIQNSIINSNKITYINTINKFM